MENKNMKTNILILIALFLTINAFSQAPNWQWAKSAGGSRYEYGQNNAVDITGNTYVTGTFSSPSITFGSITLINSDSIGYYDMYITKYDVSGNVVWARTAGGTAKNEEGKSVSTDASGNVYVTGVFESPSITFGSITLINADSTGYYDMFVVKYDVNGNVIWAKRAGGIKDDYGYAIAVDGNGNSYITGTFFNSTITFGSITLTNNGTNTSSDMFIVKYDTNGNVVWAKSAGGSVTADYGYGIALDANGNSYVTGDFGSPSITFGGTTLINANPISPDMFIVKYDSIGTVIWAKSAGGNSYDHGNGIAVDGSGNSYVTGSFQSTSITFGGTTLINDSIGGGTYDMYVAKYDASGNFVWANSAGGSNVDHGYGIAVDGSGNSYVVGYFHSLSITFGNTVLTKTGAYNMFIVKYDASGNVVWAKSVGGNAPNCANGIALDGSGNSYITGYFGPSSLTFGTTTLTFAGNCDIFVVKLNNLIGIEEMPEIAGFTISPNPFTFATTLTFNEPQKNTIIKITDVLGKEIKTINFTGKECVIEKGEMKTGVYFVEVIDENKNVVNRKLVVQ